MFREKLRIGATFFEKVLRNWPKRPVRIVVWVEGEIRGYEVVSKHSKRVPACWDIPDPYEKRRLPMANRKRNINQIAKRVNAGGGAYKADMREIQERLDEIWQLQRRILSSGR